MQTNAFGLAPSQNESMVLEEEIDEDYEPTEAEILEYAEYIGINTQEDRDLLYLAKEGLKAPLPLDWKPCQNREGKIYYFNFKTKQSQWEHPCDEHYKKLYQELRKKKSMSRGFEQTSVKNPSVKPANKLTSFPLKSQQPLPKHNPLPVLKLNPIGGQNNQNDFGPSFSVDNLATYALNHNKNSIASEQDMSLSTGRKSDEKSQPVEFENFFTLGSDSGANEEIDIPANVDESDSDSHQITKDEELSKLEEKYKVEVNKLEKKLERKLKEDLQNFKKELLQNSQGGPARDRLNQEKEQIRSSKKSEFKRRTDDEIRRLDREHNSKKKDDEVSQAKSLKEDRKSMEDDLKEEYEAKRTVLLDEKKRIENEIERTKLQQKEEKLIFEQELDEEKRAVLNEFTSLLRTFELEQKHSQGTEVIEYGKHLKEKLVEERKVIVLAGKQRESVKLDRKKELNELFERRFELEKKRFDNQNTKRLQDYIEVEKKKRDEEDRKLHETEHKQEKERRESQIQNEMRDLKAHYMGSLEDYQRKLQSRFANQRNNIDKENAKHIDEHRRSISSVTIDVSNKHDLLKQLHEFRTQKYELDSLENLDKKIMSQREENSDLQRQIDALHRRQKEFDTGRLQTIKELKHKVKVSDNEIAQLSDRNKRDTNSKLRARPKSSVNFSKQANQSANLLTTIRDNVKEISSFITKGQEDAITGRSTKRREYGSKIVTNPLEKCPLWRPDSFRDVANGIHHQSSRDWQEVLDGEVEKIQDLKQSLKREKLSLKQSYEEMLHEREQIQQEYFDSANSADEHYDSDKEDVLKKRKRDLNEEIRTLNQNVAAVKKREELLKVKEASLSQLKKAVERFYNEEINSGDLDAMYQNYIDVDFVYGSDAEHKPKIHERRGSTLLDTSNRASATINYRPKTFFRNSVGVSSSRITPEPYRIDLSRAAPRRQSYNGKENYRNTRTSREKVHRGYADQSSDYDRKDYSYNSLMNALELKVKSEMSILQTENVKRQIVRSTELKAKMNNVFCEHSRWLKDVKDQLNSHLYEKKGKYPSFFLKN